MRDPAGEAANNDPSVFVLISAAVYQNDGSSAHIRGVYVRFVLVADGGGAGEKPAEDCAAGSDATAASINDTVVRSIGVGLCTPTAAWSNGPIGLQGQPAHVLGVVSSVIVSRLSANATLVFRMLAGLPRIQPASGWRRGASIRGARRRSVAETVAAGVPVNVLPR